MGSSSYWMTSVAYAFSAVGSGVVEIVFLVAILTVVRRSRPDAVPLLASGVVVGLVTSVIAMLNSFVGARFISSSSAGIEGYTRYLAASHMGIWLVAMVGHVLVILGVLKLARPQGYVEPVR